MDRPLIVVHGQTLTTCTAGELGEVINFIKMNVCATCTTPFEKGTIICDSNGTQRLDLCKQQLGPTNTELICKAMTENDKISALLLGANGIGNNGAKAIADLIKRNQRNLTTISLGCNLIQTDGIRDIADSLQLNQHVRGLWLKRNSIGIEGSKYIANMLRNNTCLRTLDLVSTGLQEEGLIHIINGLTDNWKDSALQRIFLGALNIHNVSFISKWLSKMFINCVNLKEIFLSTNDICDLGAIELAKIMLIAPQVEILSLKSCNIGDDGAIALAWIITSHPNLKYLDFGYAMNTNAVGAKANRISDRGACMFAQALAVILANNGYETVCNSKFQRLCLASNEISDIGARSILSVLQNANKNGNYQMLHVALDRNEKIKNSVTLHYISKICQENEKWNESKENKNIFDDDIKMDGRNNIEIGVSNDLRYERIVKQQIYTKLGEIRWNENVKNANDLSGAEIDSLSIRSVYRNRYPKGKQFCPRVVKDVDNDSKILDPGIASLNNPKNNNKRDDMSKFIGNKNIRKRANKKFWKIKNIMNKNSNEAQSRFDIYGNRSPLEPAPKLSSHERLAHVFGSITNEGDLENDKLHFSRKCYVCKKAYTRLHFFYDSMCRACGDYNFYQRFDGYSCMNKVAIVTGGRVKIGYEIALKLLRSQCHVIVTTRFPRYAAIKYASEKDFKLWQDNLCILGLDFCRLNSVDKFIKYITSTYKHIDFLINNAATTVRRTPDFYKDIIEIEKKKLPANIPQKLVIQYEHFTDSNQVAPPLAIESNEKKAIKYKHNLGGKETENIINKVLGDLGDYDEHSQPIDLRTNNSWTATLGNIHPVEIMETIMVNQFVPFLFINQLIPVLSNKKEVRSNYARNNYNNNNNKNSGKNQTEKEIWKEINGRLRENNYNRSVSCSYIINVSAMEGRFHFFKQGTHPHTNMAKAALNMLTRTSSLKLALQHNIFMVSVDTGWVTDELPLKRRIKSQIFQRSQEHLLNNKNKNDKNDHDKNDFIFHPPLDEIDGAARVLHPIWCGLRGKPYCGVFLKDYRRIDW